jgi:hypothetical protein
MFHTAWEIGCQIQNRLVSPREPRDAVPCSGRRFAQNSCKRRTAQSSRSKDSSSSSQTSPLRGLTGGLLMLAIPMFYAICVGCTGWAGFSARILYLAGLLAQFRFRSSSCYVLGYARKARSFRRRFLRVSRTFDGMAILAGNAQHHLPSPPGCITERGDWTSDLTCSMPTPPTWGSHSP